MNSVNKEFMRHVFKGFVCVCVTKQKHNPCLFTNTQKCKISCTRMYGRETYMLLLVLKTYFMEKNVKQPTNRASRLKGGLYGCIACLNIAMLVDSVYDLF